MKKAFLQLHIAVFLAGFTGVLGRLITLNEFVFVWYRLMIACVVLWLSLFYSKEKIIRFSKTYIEGISCWVSPCPALGQFYAGIKISNVSTALVCLSSMGFFTAILEPLMLRKHFDLIEILLGLLVIAGISIVFHFDPQYKMGIIISLISAFLASVFPILNRELIAIDGAGNGYALATKRWLSFSHLLLPVYLYYFPDSRLFPSISDWVWLIVLGIVCTVISYDLFMKAFQKISAFTVNLSYNLEPIYGIALAFIIYREDKTVSPGFYYGFCLIIAAVILQSLRLRKISGGKFSEL